LIAVDIPFHITLLPGYMLYGVGKMDCVLCFSLNVELHLSCGNFASADVVVVERIIIIMQRLMCRVSVIRMTNRR